MPQKVYQSKKVVDLCTASAVVTCNDGEISMARVLKKVGITPVAYTIAGATAANKKRIRVAEQQATKVVKLRRKRLRAIRKGLWDRQKEKEGPSYQSVGS